MDFAEPGPLDHQVPAEVNSPSTPERNCVADQHDLLVVLHPLHDLFGLDEPPRDVLAAARLVARTRIMSRPDEDLVAARIKG